MYNIFKNLFRLILLLGCGFGLALIMGIIDGEFRSNQLVFYTIQSNIAIFIVYLILQTKTIQLSLKNKKLTNSNLSSNIMGGITLMIVVTGLIYNLILAPSVSDLSAYSANSLSNFLIHSFTPLMVFLDWIFFVREKNLKKIKPLTWVIIPLAYWIFTIIRAIFGEPIAGFDSYYPYFFIDIDIYGFPKVLLNVFLLVIFFVIFGYLMKLIKYIELKFGKNKAEKAIIDG